MLDLGLSVAQRRTYEAALTGTYQLRVRVALQDLAGRELADLSGRLLDGQVNLDVEAETTRQATLSLDDPSRSLNLDSYAPADGALFADRMVSITYGVFVTDLARWVDVPVFVGPITGMDRDGDSVNLTCLGKEHLAKGSCWTTLTYKKGRNVLSAIRSVLQTRAGETRFIFPTTGPLARARLGRDYSLTRASTPWGAATTWAASIGAVLYYDGAGRCVLKDDVSRGAWRFKDGDGGSVLSTPKVSYDLSTVVNAVAVTGAKPKGHKAPIRATVVADRSHPSPPTGWAATGSPATW